MSQPFSFPPPPPPPPKREPAPIADFRNAFQGRGGSRGQHPRGGSQQPRGRGTYPSQGGSRGRGNFSQRASAPKRDFGTAFTSHSPKQTTAHPSVPSFNVDIKSLLPPKSESSPQNVSKRKTNLLGLTPLGDDMSESDDDLDDEAKVGTIVLTEGIQFEHKGQQLSLRTPAEIAAWIAERKKRFPTRAKADAAKKEAEEKKNHWEAQKKVREEAWRLKKEEQRRERSERERQRLKEKLLNAQVAKAKSTLSDSKENIASKAKLKAEKLRKKAEKAARELQLAEEQLRLSEQAAQSSDEMTAAGNDGIEMNHDNAELSTQDDEDDTSSSGSSDTDSGSGSEPEEISSKRLLLDRVPPPQLTSRTDGNAGPPLCKNMVRFGRCKYGKKCRYSHKIQKDKHDKNASRSDKRKSLYQIMVEKEQEEEMRRALRAIIVLGEQGMLEEPGQPAVPTDPQLPENDRVPP